LPFWHRETAAPCHALRCHNAMPCDAIMPHTCENRPWRCVLSVSGADPTALGTTSGTGHWTRESCGPRRAVLRLPRRRPPRRMRVSRRSPRQVRTAGLTVHDVIAPKCLSSACLAYRDGMQRNWRLARLSMSGVTRRSRYSMCCCHSCSPSPLFGVCPRLRVPHHTKSVTALPSSTFVLQGEVACYAA
jgi:hypothetical protein